MATIKRIPFLRHVRSDASRYLMMHRRGRLRRSGRGLAFWFSPLAASLTEIPCDDREVSFLFHTSTTDFQQVTVQGAITYRVADAEALATRVDFTIDTATGRYQEQPLERIADLLTQFAQRVANEFVAAVEVRVAITDGVPEIRRRLAEALQGDAALAALGIEIVNVHVSGVAPVSELEKALQAPTRESIQQRSDEAVFQRRALAVEKERAIGENEIQSRIELARREESLIAQEGANERRRAQEAAEAEAVTARARAANGRLEAETAAEVLRIDSAATAAATREQTSAEAEGIRVTEEARVAAERERMETVRDLPQHVLIGLAAREFAGKLQTIERIQVTPDMLGSLLSDLAAAGSSLVPARGVEGT